jgi:YfiH family protein
MTHPPIIVSPLLATVPGVRHGFFTRRGGVSGGVYDSLNVGLGSRDDPAAVIENRRRAAAAFDAPESGLVTCYQVHSARVEVAPGPWADDRPHADGVVTGQAGVLCGALAADCAPVLIADGDAGVVAAVHAGWRGALGGVIDAAVAAAVGLGAIPERMTAAVGPCIGPDSYEVGEDFLATFLADSKEHARFFRPGAAPDRRRFDLPAFVLSRLAKAGVARAEWVGRDTCAEVDDFFSNRRAFHRGEGDYGRLLSLIVLDS